MNILNAHQSPWLAPQERSQHGFSASMDDLVSDTGLEDTRRVRLKYYNKALISYLSQQGMNMNPLKLGPRNLHSKDNSSNNLSSTPSSIDTVETFVTGNGQILFLPFNPMKKKRRRNNIHDEYNDDDDNDHEDDDDDESTNGNHNHRRKPSHSHSHLHLHLHSHSHSHSNEPNYSHSHAHSQSHSQAHTHIPSSVQRLGLHDVSNDAIDAENLNDEADQPYDPSDYEINDSPSLEVLSGTAMPSTGSSATGTGNDLSNTDSEHLPHNTTYHNFGVIVKVKKSITLNTTVKVNYHTHASIKWVPSELPRKEPFDERYRISENIDWDLDLKNPDCYIPFTEAGKQKDNYVTKKNSGQNAEATPPFTGMEDDDSFDNLCPDITINDSLDSETSFGSVGDSQNASNLGIVKFSKNPTQTVKSYKPLSPKHYVNESKLLNNDVFVERNLFSDRSGFSSAKITGETLEPGYYIFLLPVLYPLNTVETVLAPNASIRHEFTIQIQKGNVQPPSLQAPPSAFISTSPNHHNNYEEQNFELSNGFQASQHNQSKIQTSTSPPLNIATSNTKSSFLKIFGIRRNSVTSQESKSRRGSAVAGSVPMDFRGRSRSGSVNVSTNTINSYTPTNPIIFNYNYHLPAVRLPPSDATSTLNKSIYVNKVWNNALNYELLLPKKFTQLSPPRNLNVSSDENKFLHDNTFLLKMKLVPLAKNLLLKRIKINIVEKITYIPKDNLNSAKPKGKCKEKVVTMLEIKTKEKSSSNSNNGSSPWKTEIIKGCANDNLLTFCYNNESSNPFTLDNSSNNHASSSARKNSFKNASPSGFLHSSRKMSRLLDGSLSMSHNHNSSGNSNNNINNKDDIVITNPVKLQCPLTFVANDDFKFIEKVYDNLCTTTSEFTDLNDNFDLTTKPLGDSMSIFSVTSNGPAAPVLSDEEDSTSFKKNRNFSFSSNNQNIQNNWSEETPTNTVSPSFLPDVTFSHMKVRHRLQISFRISKPDDKVKNSDGEPKMHHYEVIVDTPIVFVSPFCVSETLDLPSYDDAVKSGMFEVTKNPKKFAISRTTSDWTSSSEESTVFAPCSPLMSDASPMMSGNFPLGPSASSTTTHQMTLPSYEDTIIRSRSNSGYSNLGTSPVNASSLLSNAFARAKDRSSSLNSLIANTDLSMSNTALVNTSIPEINTIDGLIESDNGPSININARDITPVDDSVKGSPPPDYSEVGHQKEAFGDDTFTEKSLNKELNKLQLENKDSPIIRPVLSNRPSNISRRSLNNSNLSLRSEGLQLLPNQENDDNISLCDTSSNLTKNVLLNGSIESAIGEVDKGMELNSIINMSVGNLATLNYTPTNQQ